MGTHYRGSDDEQRALNAYIRMTRALDTIQTKLHRNLKTLGLTMSQLGVLEALLHLGPMCQREMGDKLLMSRANVTTVVDNLEKHGLVKRVQDGEDRRMLKLHLTPKGEELIRDVFPKHLAVITETMHALSAEELETLGALSKKLGLANQPD